jgi:hypothetical protein
MKQFLNLSLALMTGFILVACGNNPNCPAGQIAQGNTCVIATAGGYNNGYNNGFGQNGMNGNGNQCPSGQFPTQYGCLTQDTCPAGQAFYPQGRTCVPVIQNGGNGGYYGGGGYGGYYGGGYGGYGGYNCPAGMGFSRWANTCLPVGPCPWGLYFFNGSCVP